MQRSFGNQSKKFRNRYSKKASPEKKPSVPSPGTRNLVKMDCLAEQQLGISPMKGSRQLILSAEHLIRNFERQPEIHQHCLREARELRTVQFFLSKAREKLTVLMPSQTPSTKTKTKRRYLKIV